MLGVGCGGFVGFVFGFVFVCCCWFVLYVCVVVGGM